MPVVKKSRISNPAGLLSIMSNGKAAARKRMSNVAGFVDGSGEFHPIRGSSGYDGTLGGDKSLLAKWKKQAKKKSGVKAQAPKKSTQGRGGGVLSMKTKKKKNTASKPKAKKSYKKNPSVVNIVEQLKRAAKPTAKAAKKNGGKKKSYKKNPQFAGFTITSALKLGGGALVGSVGTPALTHVVMKNHNVGVKGVLGNVVAGAALTYGASKVDATVAAGVAAGAVSSVALRIWETWIAQIISDGKPEMLHPAAAAAVNTDGTPKLGDVRFSGSGLGFYSESTWPGPTIGKRLPSPQNIASGYNGGHDESFVDPFAQPFAAA